MWSNVIQIKTQRNRRYQHSLYLLWIPGMDSSLFVACVPEEIPNFPILLIAELFIFENLQEITLAIKKKKNY